MMLRSVLMTISCLVLVYSVATAQEAPTCPPAVLIDLARASSTCYGLESEQACIGNGTAQVSLNGGETSAPQPGDRFDASDVRWLETQSSGEDLSVSLLNLRANLTPVQQQNIAVVMVGDVKIVNDVDVPMMTLNGIAQGSLHIRRLPEANSEIVLRLGVNAGVVADGRTVEGDWVRVQIPNSNDVGWAAVEVLAMQGNAQTLPIVSADTEILRPFEQFRLQTRDTAFCGGALTSGLLIQTPSSDEARLTMNGVEMVMSGTFFLQANKVLTVYALHGETTLSAGGGSAFVPAGAFAFVPLDADSTANGVPSEAEGFDRADVRALPIATLPTPIQIAEPVSAEGIAQAEAAYQAAQQAAEATIAPPPVEDNRCRRTVFRQTSLYAGPGYFYEAINEIREGARIEPILQTNDPDGETWWQLRNNNWIPANRVEERGDCAAIPFTSVVVPPTSNTLSLETCETTNGPLHAGQYVTIVFTPPPWDNYGEAHDAPIIDPGRITIGSHHYRTQASEMIRIGTEPDRYLRHFSIMWEAEPGTYRIEGDRVSYTPICTITVPVG
jgi:hypothetical protein